MNFFSVEVSKFCQLRVLNKFIQQRFSLLSKAYWTEKFLKFKPLAYLEPCEKSMMNFFCEYITPFSCSLFSQKHSIVHVSQSSESVSEIYLIF